MNAFLRVFAAVIILTTPAFAAQEAEEAPPSETERQDQTPESEGEGQKKEKDSEETAADDTPAKDGRPKSLLRLGPFLNPSAIEPPSAADLVGKTGDRQGEESAQADGTGPEGGQTPALPDDPSTLVPEDGVAVGSLDQLGLTAIGAMPREEALPVDLWRLSQPEMAAALMRALPTRMRSPASRDLFRRLLLSPAAPPKAGPVPDALEIRLEKLTRAGRVDDVIALSEEIPQSAMTKRLAHLRADALLVGGRLDDGCNLARNAVRETGEAHWLKMLALCEALAGNRGGAYLQINLLEEAEEVGMVFPALIDRLLAQAEGLSVQTSVPVAELERVGPILYATLLAADVAPPEAAARTAPPLVLGELATNALLEPPARIGVAEEAARHGLIGGARLAALFDAMAFTEADLGTADSVLTDSGAMSGLGAPENPPLDGMMIDALLFAKARQAESPDTRLAFMRILFDRAVQRGYPRVMAEALQPLLDTVAPHSALLPHAELVGRLQLMTGRPAAALRWYRFALNNAGKTAADRALETLTPLLLMIRGPEMPGYDNALERWAKVRRGPTPIV